MRLVLTWLSIFYWAIAFAQDKIEIEKRIKAEEVPSVTVENLTHILGSDHKVKWYYQKDGSKKVYEAKFKLNDKRYSVEFDTVGAIYNVEVNTSLEDLSIENSEMLSKNLTELFQEYTIRKIQYEYFGEERSLFRLISDQVADDGLIQQFEVEVKVKSNKKRKLFEIILSDKFNLISKREIRVQSTDLLDY